MFLTGRQAKVLVRSSRTRDRDILLLVEEKVKKVHVDTRGTRWSKLALGVTALLACGAISAACSSGTSSADKTATAAKGATTPAATKASATSTAAATAAATKASSTPAAGTTQPSGTIGVKVGSTALGQVLTDAKGFTLYTFKNDIAGNGKSAAEALAAVWPPLSLDAAPSNVAGASGTWAVFTRVDGKKQVTYNGSPLYTFANDAAPGDTKGDKVGGVWFAALP
jgi:predicted lipoprotein with Yx(FWY)xxD motif